MTQETPKWLLPSVWETERLRLRPWREDDAAELYRRASDPLVGPAAGWVPHQSEADSLEVLRTILMKENTWAVTLRGSDTPEGSLGVFPTTAEGGDGQPEIGYWLARPLWGRGYIPEAVKALIGLCFAAGVRKVWCAHAVGNDKSRRVIEKCGFVFCCEANWTGADGLCRRSRYYAIPQEEWTV